MSESIRKLCMHRANKLGVSIVTGADGIIEARPPEGKMIHTALGNVFPFIRERTWDWMFRILDKAEVK
jgi:hypothetical protein